jgi:hypothetical protein
MVAGQIFFNSFFFFPSVTAQSRRAVIPSQARLQYTRASQRLRPGPGHRVMVAAATVTLTDSEPQRPP